MKPIEPRHHARNSIGRRDRGRWRGPIDHHHRNAERMRRIEFFAHYATGILGDQKIDFVRGQKFALTRARKRPARGNHGAIGRKKSGIGRIDAPDQVVMPGSLAKGHKILTPDGQKHPARGYPERLRGGGDIGDGNPVRAGRFLPWRAPEREQGNAGDGRCRLRIGRNARGERMGRIDQGIESSLDKKSGQTLGAAGLTCYLAIAQHLSSQLGTQPSLPAALGVLEPRLGHLSAVGRASSLLRRALLTSLLDFANGTADWTEPIGAGGASYASLVAGADAALSSGRLPAIEGALDALRRIG